MNPESTGAPSSVPATIETAAAAWLSLRDRGMSAEETADFVRWLQEDPRHATTFAELDAAWREFDRLGAVPAGGPAEPDPDLLAPRFRPRRRRFRPLAAAVVLAAAAAVAWLAYPPGRAAQTSVATAVGAFQKLDLPDGSVAQLNTDTAIATTFSAGERRVTVLRGEAYFNVRPDAQRPFIVTAGSVAVRAVGTAFNVRWRETDVEVLVAEGQVRVHDAADERPLLAASGPAAPPPVLAAGERVRVPARADRRDAPPRAAQVEKIGAPEVQRALAWQERRLEFDATPLADAVREFNRYNRRQLQIADPELASKRFSGSFRSDGYEAFVGLLERDFGVRATRREQEIVLRLDR